MKEKAKKLLRTALNDPTADFRNGQWECIEPILHSKRMLVVQRTGWGKSMVYFLATRMLRDAGGGFTLLISPLLALMRNQIQAAEMPKGSVVLMDDMVDSGWTLTVIAALLREAGCPAVSPIVLAVSSPRGR